MKRLLVFVLAVVLFVSCSKNRTVHFEAALLSNTNIYFLNLQGNCYTNNGLITMNMGVTGDEIPIQVGEIYRTSRNLNAKKGDIICLSFGAYCDSITTSTDTIQCDFEMSLGFFVDEVLVEERIISHSSSEIIQVDPFNFIGNPSILEKTIDFTVS
tara:strand:- start:56 stop:523 length:468 start_codon:yes stop_codon:yes gene_type:complete